MEFNHICYTYPNTLQVVDKTAFAAVKDRFTNHVIGGSHLIEDIFGTFSSRFTAELAPGLGKPMAAMVLMENGDFLATPVDKDLWYAINWDTNRFVLGSSANKFGLDDAFGIDDLSKDALITGMTKYNANCTTTPRIARIMVKLEDADVTAMTVVI